MTSNGSANEAPRGTRAKELNKAEAGGRNDIITIILANGSSYDLKERVVLPRLLMALPRPDLCTKAVIGSIERRPMTIPHERREGVPSKFVASANHVQVDFTRSGALDATSYLAAR
jgi:hypothetical protein